MIVWDFPRVTLIVLCLRWEMKHHCAKMDYTLQNHSCWDISAWIQIGEANRLLSDITDNRAILLRYRYMYQNTTLCFFSCCVYGHTVQITFIFIGQTRLVFGKRVCTCVTKYSNAFRTFLNWLKNSKRVLHEPKLHISRLPLFANCDLWSVSVWWV